MRLGDWVKHHATDPNDVLIEIGRQHVSIDGEVVSVYDLETGTFPLDEREPKTPQSLKIASVARALDALAQKRELSVKELDVHLVVEPTTKYELVLHMLYTTVLAPHSDADSCAPLHFSIVLKRADAVELYPGQAVALDPRCIGSDSSAFVAIGSNGIAISEDGRAVSGTGYCGSNEPALCLEHPSRALELLEQLGSGTSEGEQDRLAELVTLYDLKRLSLDSTPIIAPDPAVPMGLVAAVIDRLTDTSNDRSAKVPFLVPHS